MKATHVTIFIDNWFNPIDLESYTKSSGELRFDSIGAAFNFIDFNKIYELVSGKYVEIHPTYHSIQKKLKRYGYFKAYTNINGYFMSFMIKA